jgi:hypothetical protein
VTGQDMRRSDLYWNDFDSAASERWMDFPVSLAARKRLVRNYYTGLVGHPVLVVLVAWVALESSSREV